MQAGDTLASAGLAGSIAVIETMLAGLGRYEVAHDIPAVWLSECVQNCHFAVKDQREYAGQGPGKLGLANATWAHFDELPDGPNHASNC
jgi:hypothetical protein